jgi:hypothetical protein
MDKFVTVVETLTCRYTPYTYGDGEDVDAYVWHAFQQRNGMFDSWEDAEAKATEIAHDLSLTLVLP